MPSKTVAVVTGASQGIGRATALSLARDFSVIVLVARNEKKLEKSAAEIRSLDAEPMICALDLPDPQSAEIMVKSVLNRFGRIDALVNIAGAVP